MNTAAKLLIQKMRDVTVVNLQEPRLLDSNSLRPSRRSSTDS